MIGWKDYPKPNLRFIRNVWVVEVSIPTPIRHLFGNGSGTTNNKRKATGTTDKAIAEKRVTELAHKIYKEFDDKQLEYNNRNNRQTDKYAESIIYGLAKAMKYNRGVVPTLDPSTDYDALKDMKIRFDNAFEQVEDEKADAPSDYSSVEAKLDKLLAEKSVDDFSTKLQRINFPDVTKTPAIVRLLSKHSEPIVQSYWQDLLTEASVLQGKTAPIFDEILDKHDYIMVGEGTEGIPQILKKPPETGLMGFKNQAHHKPISRPMRKTVKSTSNMISFLDEYFVAVERDQDKKDTIRKLKKGVRLFVELIGDLPLQDIDQTTVYSFMDKQLEARPNVSVRVLRDNNWSIRSFFKFCIEKGYVKDNPVSGVDLGRRGKPAQTYLNYTRDELHTIFSHNWKPQERLLLSILITTGMRLSETSNLSWERYSDDHDGIQGMRCFSLLNTSDETVAVKNKGSIRIIPLHPDLELPPKGTGRLFDYKLNEDGLSSHDAGRAINPTLQKLVPHPQKMAHSFRGTLKEFLRDAGVSKEISDFYTGHSSGDVAGISYGGVGVDTRHHEISKVRHPWLKYKSNLG
ncbi:hypothetical protein OAD94_02665 [Amylibacter sp.]|nr:hypothetical protein [Amylibacter sp.]